MVTLLTPLVAKDVEAAGRLRVHLAELERRVRDERGNLSYRVLGTRDDPPRFHILESWATAADADRHAARVVEDGTAGRSAPLLAEPLTTVVLVPLLEEAPGGTSG